MSLLMTFFFALLLILLPSAVLSTSYPFVTYHTANLPNYTFGPAYLTIPRNFITLTGISDGDIVKYNLSMGNFASFASEPYRIGPFCLFNVTPLFPRPCGRPLGIAYTNSGYVYFCNSDNGLFGVEPSGGPATQLVTYAGGKPVFYCNAVDIDGNGTVYFTDASQSFRNVTQSVASNDTSGRLIRYVPSTRTITVLATELFAPTGIAVSYDGSCLLISQFGDNSIMKFHLTGPKANKLEILVREIARPTNVRRSLDGHNYYVPQTPQPYNHSLVKINSAGTVLQNITIAGPYSNVTSLTDAQQFSRSPFLPRSKFLLGSLDATFLGILTILGI